MECGPVALDSDNTTMGEQWGTLCPLFEGCEEIRLVAQAYVFGRGKKEVCAQDRTGGWRSALRELLIPRRNLG